MAINPVVAQHLKDARSELVEQRDALNRDIAQLDSMLQGYDDTAPAASGATLTLAAGAGTISTPGPGPALKDAILTYLASEDRAFTTAEVAADLNETYGWELSSIRSQLSKMGKAGEVFQVRRGVYCSMELIRREVSSDHDAARNDAAHGVLRPQNASGPDDEPGPEVQVTTTGAGGDSHAQASQDHGDDLAERSRDYRGGTPLVMR